MNDDIMMQMARRQAAIERQQRRAATLSREANLTATIALGAGQFAIGYGSPTYGAIGGSGWGVACWALDDAAVAELVGAAVEYKGLAGGSTLYVDVWWAMVSATSGNVRIAVGVDSLADGESVTGSATIVYQTVAVPGTAALLKKTTFTLTETYAQDDLIKVMFARYGSDAADTAAGDLLFIAATVRLG
jgi:hypothetical protein